VAFHLVKFTTMTQCLKPLIKSGHGV